MSTREAILRATLRVVGEHGVAGLTNRRIVARAGISLGSLTYHFPSQTTLLREAMLLFADEEARRLAELARQHDAAGLTVEQAAEVVADVLGRLPASVEEIAALELYLQAGRDASLREAARRCFAAYEELAEAVLRALGVPRPRQLAGPVVALLAGLQLRGLATGEAHTTSTAEALTMLVRGGQEHSRDAGDTPGRTRRVHR